MRKRMGTALGLAAVVLAGCGAPIQPMTLTPGQNTITIPPPPSGALQDTYSIDAKPGPGCSGDQVVDKISGSLINLYTFNQANAAFGPGGVPPPGMEVTVNTNLGDLANNTPQQYQFQIVGNGCTDTNWGSLTITWVSGG